MKFYQKIFFCMLFFLTVALSISGLLFIGGSFQTVLKREKERGINEYQLAKFSLQAGILNAKRSGELNDDHWDAIIKQTKSVLAEDTVMLLGDVYSDLPFEYTAENWEDTKTQIKNQVIESEGSYWMVYEGYIEQSKESVLFVFGSPVDSIFEEREQQIKTFIITFLILFLLSGVCMYLVTIILTKPIRRLTEASGRIQNGQYGEKVPVISKDELGELSATFNLMSGTIKEKIEDLEKSVRRQEEFTADFAHELKTPLTSIIGYADMIYQKEMNRDKVKAAAGYIVNEGLRLETLGKKMLSLIELDKSELQMEAIDICEFFKDIKEVLELQADKRKVELEWKIEPAEVMGEYDLLKTMVLNLIENSMKAEANKIIVSGQKQEIYCIFILDDGMGMESKELGRITDAFYMVDKSRKRTDEVQSSGLGLSIADKVAKLHSTELVFKSELGEGTEVSFCLFLQNES